jgi:hypothetical protein
MQGLRRKWGRLLLGARDFLDAALDVGHAVGVPDDDEDGVVAGDGAEDLRPLFPVEGFGDGLGAAGEGSDDEEVAGAFGGDEESGKEPVEGRRVVPGFWWQGVEVAAFCVGHLEEAEFAEVPGEGGLADVEAADSEEFAELLLAGHPVALDDFADGGVAHSLAHGSGRCVVAGCGASWRVRATVCYRGYRGRRIGHRKRFWPG